MKRYLAKRNRGMTYVELIVVLSIFAIMGSITLFDYGKMQSRVEIKNLANKIALQIVQAQKDAMSGRQLDSGIFVDKPAYGVVFSSSPDSRNSFIYFADRDGNGKYFSSIDTKIGSTFLINKGNFISDISKNDINGNCDPAYISFKRPNSGAVLICNGNESVNKIVIKVQSPKGDTANIQVDVNGRVQIN